MRLRTRPAASAGHDERRVLASRQRFVRRQRARRFRVLRRVLLGLALLGLVAGGLWLVFFSSVLAVQGARVEGTEVLEPAAVASAADVPLGAPLATVDLDAVAARVEGLAAVRSAEVSRAWPDQVRIEVTEREAVAALEWQGRWRGLDPSGVLFRTYPERPAGLPVLAVKATTPVDALAEAAAVVAALPPVVRGRLAEVEVGSIDDITVHLRGGAVVTWGSADESAEKAAVLELLMKHDARAYDVTAPGRPTLRK